MIGLPIMVMIYGVILMQSARVYGWTATLSFLVAPVFLGVAFLCFAFPNTRILAYPFGLSGILLLIGACVHGWTRPVARARRIMTWQQRQAERLWAHETIENYRRNSR